MGGPQEFEKSCGPQTQTRIGTMFGTRSRLGMRRRWPNSPDDRRRWSNRPNSQSRRAISTPSRGNGGAKFCQAALRSRPGDFVLLMELGTSYPLNQQKGASERLRWFQAAVAVHPANPATRNGLAVALHDNGDLDGAIAGYREAIK